MAATRRAPRGASAAEMLVRALKVLRFSKEWMKPRTGIATAALNQPGDEACAYKRAIPFWQ
jgi:hypothetical protein